MKRILFTLLLIAVLCGSVIGQNKNIYAPLDARWFENSLSNPMKNWLMWADPLIGSGSGVSGSNAQYYVDSNVTTEGNGTTWETAKDTLDEAINLVSVGDFIHMAEGHVETQAATGAVWTADIAGVTIIGYGVGTKRPTFNLSHTGAKIDITADNVLVSNILIDATGVDSVNTPVNMSGIGSALVNSFLRLGDTNGQADVGITIGVADGDANDMTIGGCVFAAPNAGAASAITFAKDMENVLIAGCIFNVDASTAVIEVPAGGNAQVNLVIDNCIVYSLNADEPAVEINGTGNTGTLKSSILVSDVEATILDAGGLQVSEDTRLIVIGNSEPGALPASMGLVDLIGDYTGPDNGAAADDNIKAHLDLILADTAATSTEVTAVPLVDPNYVSYDAPRIISDTTSAMTVGNGYGAADDPVIFTVTGDILCRASATFSTQVTSTSNDTLELGIVGQTAILLVQDIVDGTAFDVGFVWTLTIAPDDNGSVWLPDDWIIISNGADIVLTINDNDLTAGVTTFYLQWVPMSPDAAVVGAAP